MILNEQTRTLVMKKTQEIFNEGLSVLERHQDQQIQAYVANVANLIGMMQGMVERDKIGYKEQHDEWESSRCWY